MIKGPSFQAISEMIQYIGKNEKEKEYDEEKII